MLYRILCFFIAAIVLTTGTTRLRASQNDKQDQQREDPVIYLMETKWVRPKLIGARTEGKGKKQVDVVETKFGELRADFYLHRKTRLPFKIVTDWLGAIGQATGLGGFQTVELEDYAAVDGILMPRRITREPDIERPVGEIGRRDTERAAYQFNVTYNPKIFDSPASRKLKRHDWQP
jgi:hypothetical protein